MIDTASLQAAALGWHRPDPNTPIAVAGYRIEGILGRGGSSIVYRAQAPTGEVALKVLATPTHRHGRALAREQAALAALDHPGIARCHGVGTTEAGLPFVAMELIDGIPLDEYCERHRLDSAQRVQLCAALMDAVEHAHGRSVLHCDLKPANVLVTPTGEVVLVDFGAATRLGSLTTSATRPLTLGYAPPEQLCGEVPTIASDVYGLGATLRHLLANDAGDQSLTTVLRSAFGRDTHRARPAESAPQTLDTIHRSALAVADRACRPEPADRYRSVRAMAKDLERVLAGRPTLAERRATAESVTSTLVGRSRGQRWVRIVAACAALGTAIALRLAQPTPRWELELTRWRELQSMPRSEARAVLDELEADAIASRSQGRATVLHTLAAINAELGWPHRGTAIMSVARTIFATRSARMKIRAGRYGQAEQEIREELRRLGDVGPWRAAPLHGDLIGLLRVRGAFAEAESLARTMLTQSPSEFRRIRALSDLGLIARDRGHFHEAREHLTAALAGIRAASEDSTLHRLEATTHLRLIAVLGKLGEFDAARQHARAVLAVPTNGRFDPDDLVGYAWRELGVVERDAGRHLLAEQAFTQALAELRPRLGLSHVEVAETLIERAELWLVQGQRHRASEELARVPRSPDWPARVQAKYDGLEQALNTSVRTRVRASEAAPAAQTRARSRVGATPHTRLGQRATGDGNVAPGCGVPKQWFNLTCVVWSFL